MKQILYYLPVLLFILSCSYNQDLLNAEKTSVKEAKGKLFIIGGGKRPLTLMQDLIYVANINENDYVVILPMASSEPDSSFFYAKKQFLELGISQVLNFNFVKDSVNESWIETMKNAKLIYIPGGDQNIFMDVVLNAAVYETLRAAYFNGATIAGTSAGAAVMSEKMITGNELKHPEYTGEYQTIEANNIEMKTGMGFLSKCIIDQHFIKRMRMNRLITTALENPGYICIGIDESTALVVTPDSSFVAGESQIVVLKNSEKAKINDMDLLGGKGMELSIYLPGEKILSYIE